MLFSDLEETREVQLLYARPPMIEEVGLEIRYTKLVGLEIRYTSNLEIETETDMQLRIVAM